MSPQASRATIPGWLAYGLLAITAVGYMLVTVLTPLEPRASYGLSVQQIRILQLSLVVPVIAVWFTALWGSLRFKNYALGIYGGADGRALNTVANGLLVLVTQLALVSFLQADSHLLSRWFSMATIVIVTNYIGVGMSLIAFGLMCKGALALSRLVEYRGLRQNQTIALVILALVGGTYGWILAHNPDRLRSLDPGRIVPYYLPDHLLLLTIVLPYIVAWGMGLTAAVALRSYRRNAEGILYRRPVALLAAGLVTIIVSLMIIQLLTALGPALAGLGLQAILAVIYGLILIYAAGHVLVALGARRLSRIEEVR